jgi:hypothetical protein
LRSRSARVPPASERASAWLVGSVRGFPRRCLASRRVAEPQSSRRPPARTLGKGEGLRGQLRRRAAAGEVAHACARDERAAIAQAVGTRVRRQGRTPAPVHSRVGSAASVAATLPPPISMWTGHPGPRVGIRQLPRTTRVASPGGFARLFAQSTAAAEPSRGGRRRVAGPPNRPTCRARKRPVSSPTRFSGCRNASDHLRPDVPLQTPAATRTRRRGKRSGRCRHRTAVRAGQHLSGRSPGLLAQGGTSLSARRAVAIPRSHALHPPVDL